MDELEEGRLDAQVGTHLAGLRDERLDGGGRSGVTAAVGEGDQGWSGHDDPSPFGVEPRTPLSSAMVDLCGGDGRCHWWIPHSVLLVPDQRPAAGVLTGGDAAGARPAADGGVAVVLQRVDQDAVLGDVLLDVLVGPAGQRRDLDLLLLLVPADDRGDHPVVGLGATQTGRPGVVPTEAVGQWLHLAQRAAQVGVALEQVLAVRRILLGHRLHGGQVDQVHRHRRLDGVAGADGLGEVVAGVEEDHVDPGGDPRREVREHGVAHRGGHAEPLAEGRDGPLDDVLGRRQLELGTHVGDDLAELGGVASRGLGAAASARGQGVPGGHRDVSVRVVGVVVGRRSWPIMLSLNARRQDRHSHWP